MDTSPTDEVESDLVDEETKQILHERLKTLDEDRKPARSAKEVMAELRANLKAKPLIIE